MTFIGIYILWGSISYSLFIWSTTKFIDSQKKNSIYKNNDNKTISPNNIIMVISVISLILFILTGILFMYFLLIFAVEKPLLNKLLSTLSLWPVFSGILIIFTIDLNIRAIAKTKFKKLKTLMTIVTVISIISYYCFYGITLSFVLK